jgi:hypothetical protein
MHYEKFRDVEHQTHRMEERMNQPVRDHTIRPAEDATLRPFQSAGKKYIITEPSDFERAMEIFEQRTKNRATFTEKLDDLLSPNDWTAVLVSVLGRMAGPRGVHDATTYRQALVELIAVGIDALEAHDRRAAIRNEKVIDLVEKGPGY